MYFKPRIFISSTMGDKIKLRKNIKNFFEMAGAEVALYEKDLTPSIDKNTYRNDILQTDFVIFVIDERYGQKTNTGLSGTEEEFQIIIANNKPCHVYLKAIEKTDEAKNFENLIKSNGISYYYYKDEKELLKKLKSTCFTIARDVAYYHIDKQKINPSLIQKLALKQDIETGKFYCQIMDTLFDISNKSPYNFENSDLLIQAMGDPSEYVKASIKNILIDSKADEYLKNLCSNIKIYNDKMLNESVPSTTHMTFKLLNETIDLSFINWNPNIDLQWYGNQLKTIFDTYTIFRNYLSQMTLEAELITT